MTPRNPTAIKHKIEQTNAKLGPLHVKIMAERHKPKEEQDPRIESMLDQFDRYVIIMEALRWALGNTDTTLDHSNY